ncbi:elongator complex protein [Tasmannia lanceolata]|uniref:elongator complex protein n=1 Tax=Tasmannia lanceolata TaxID=3420 RepID=UPI00406420AE
MAESISRVLRDGALEGEHAPALTIKDTLPIAFGFDAFIYILSHLGSNISAGKSQARGLVLVALNRSPLFYFDLLKRRGFDPSASDRWIRILDCYTDPLGWKDRLLGFGSRSKLSLKASVTYFMDVGDMDKLFCSIIDIGRGVVGQGKVRFSVAIDSVSALLRHASLPSLSVLINNLRSHDQVSCIFWLLHSDLHDLRVSASLEYMSSMVATLEPLTQIADGQKSNSESLIWLEQNSRRGKLTVRLKRRNGRVKVLCEDFHMEQAGIKFLTVSSRNSMISQNLLPKVQFNLQLSEQERVDRAKVVLPFEHQGNGKAIQIYDGRRSLSEGQQDPHLVRPVTNTDSVKGEIHYLRDSDDELPDSDEDPDDDLDI